MKRILIPILVAVCIFGTINFLRADPIAFMDDYLPLAGGSMDAASHFILPLHNDAVTPTLAFGDKNTGFYESEDNKLNVSIDGDSKFFWNGNFFYAENAAGPIIYNSAASSISPTLIPNQADYQTGVGWAAASQPAMISGGVPSQVWGTKVTLTTAQINALKATPITIVAAQGANTIIELVSVVLTYNYATAAFTVGADEDLVIEYADGTDATASIETAGFLDQVDDEVRFYPSVLTAGADLEASINQALQIKNTGAGETADGGGELDVRIVYRVYATGF